MSEERSDESGRKHRQDVPRRDVDSNGWNSRGRPGPPMGAAQVARPGWINSRHCSSLSRPAAVSICAVSCAWPERALRGRLWGHAESLTVSAAGRVRGDDEGTESRIDRRVHEVHVCYVQQASCAAAGRSCKEDQPFFDGRKASPGVEIHEATVSASQR